MPERISLTEELYIAKGAHKAAYVDPRDERRCVKILFQPDDIDLQRELSYRRVLRRRGRELSMLPVYYGTVETNLGTGYVFERVLDYAGQPCPTLEDVFRAAALEPQGERVRIVLECFRRQFLQENVITTNMEAVNFMVQRLGPGEEELSIRVIDNIGTRVLIPIVCYVDYLAHRHALKYWQRFLRESRERFPEVLTDGLFRSLQAD